MLAEVNGVEQSPKALKRWNKQAEYREAETTQYKPSVAATFLIGSFPCFLNDSATKGGGILPDWATALLRSGGHTEHLPCRLLDLFQYIMILSGLCNRRCCLNSPHSFRSTTLSETSLGVLAIGDLQLVQHTSPDNTDISGDGDHIKALLCTSASIITISACKQQCQPDPIPCSVWNLQKMAAFLPSA